MYFQITVSEEVERLNGQQDLNLLNFLGLPKKPALLEKTSQL